MSDTTKKTVVLDLDAEVRPEADVKAPFAFTLKGREIKMEDPANLDWRELALVEEPGDLMRVVISAPDREYLAEQDFEAWRFNVLMEAYYNHYDLEAAVRKAKRRQQIG